MAHLSSLPSELLLHILSFLPIRDLLAFSITSRSTYALASSSLQTLSLGIYPTRVASLISQLSSTSPTASPYSRSAASNLGNSDESIRSVASEASVCDIFTEDNTIAHVIPSASELRPHTLLAFHTALTSSIISRYCVSMRHLQLSIWTLTPPIAKALASLRNLRCLCLRIEDPFGRGFLRRWVVNWGSTTDEETSSQRSLDIFRAMPEAGTGTEWNQLADAWKRLEILRLIGSEISDWQVCQILKNNPGIKELWLKKCPSVGKELLKFLGEEWQGRQGLKTLGLVDCNVDADINEEAIKYVEGLPNLKFLSLLGCRGLSNEVVERLNEDVWHIPNVELPHTSDDGLMPAVIEVDPAYVHEDD